MKAFVIATALELEGTKTIQVDLALKAQVIADLMEEEVIKIKKTIVDQDHLDHLKAGIIVDPNIDPDQGDLHKSSMFKPLKDMFRTVQSQDTVLKTGKIYHI